MISDWPARHSDISQLADDGHLRLKSKKTKRLAASNISIRQALNC
jgi:hypothetical protein